MALSFDPSNVNLTSIDPRDIICYLNSSENEFSGGIGSRVGALFIILATSMLAAFLPVALTLDCVKSTVRRPALWFYLFARYFGAGVIIATAFVQFVLPFLILMALRFADIVIACSILLMKRLVLRHVLV
jgi:solute carrier family 39 (zinc transporter), member 1/2/3